MPYIGELTQAGTIAPTDQIPLDQANSDGTTDTRRAPASLFATWLLGQVGTVEGPQGSIGPQGSQGPAGPQGMQGPVGPPGSLGPQGATGLQGVAGPQGPQGLVGATGPQGSAGPPGVAGSQGPQGLPGAAGPQGNIGPQGVAGPAGPQGPAGPGSTITSLAQTSTISATDLVGISQDGADHAITLANLLDGQTIDTGAAAGRASDSDSFWVGQGSSTMTVQSFAVLWTWIAGKLPSYRRPVIEVAANLTLDGTLHNGAILVCSQPVTLTPVFGTMGSGFTCNVVNVSASNVTFATGITTSSGTQTLPTGQAAELRAFTYTGGNVVFAQVGGGSAPAQAPGQVTGLVAGVATPSSVALTWQAPATGGAATGYIVNYRVTSVGGAWTTQSAAGISLIVSGLAAATGYDFEVIANNSAGNGAASSIVTGTTLAAPTQAPGQVIGLIASGPTASIVNLTWTAPASGGAVASYMVQYRITGGSGFNTAASGVVGNAYNVTGLTSATGYDFQVVAVNAIGNGTASAVASATTAAAAPLVPGVPTGLTAGTPTPTSMPLTWTAPSSGGAVASYTVRSSLHGANTWTTVTGISGTAYSVTDLLASTAYDFEVAAVNVTGSSAFTAATTATTIASGGTTPFNASGYLLTMGTRTGSSPFPAGTGSFVVNINDNSILADGSYTTPAAVKAAWSSQNATAPTTGLQPLSQLSYDGHNQWVAYATPPPTPGTYYLWAVATNGSGTIVAAYVAPTAYVAT